MHHDAATKMVQPKHEDAVEDDLSDAASSIAEERTLNEEPLPSYDEPPGFASEAQPEKAISTLQTHDTPEQVNSSQLPTAADPFAFPSEEPPAYPAVDAIYRPLAIPQVTPSAAAPFLTAYPTALLSFGITSQSWHSFLGTVSAFLSAKVSQQAVHHAADIASDIGDFHKQYALRTKEGFRNIGKSAKRLSPGGVVGGTVEITLGGVSHIVTTVFQAAGSLRRKPQTPRERATLYVETANKDWFHSRGLHAVLMDTSELSRLCEVEVPDLLSATLTCDSTSAAEQLAALKDIIGEVSVEDASESRAASIESFASSSKAAGKRPMTPQLRLGGTTLWLVLVQSQDDIPPHGTSSGRGETAGKR